MTIHRSFNDIVIWEEVSGSFLTYLLT
jgi:hypothetical protein